MTQTNQKLKGAFIAVTSLFFIWGFITVLVDALIPRLKEVFELEYWQAGLVQFAWFTAYGLVSIPAGIYLSRTSYKRGIVTGLLIAGVGCLTFYPAAEFRVFGIFLAALFILASGITVLQVAANPYISVLGAPEGAASRLNLAQAFNSLGTTIAPLISAAFLLSDKIYTTDELNVLSESESAAYYASEASAVQMPFALLALSLIGLAVIFRFVKLPNIISGDHISLQSVKTVLSNRRLMFGALCIFVYVGAEVAIGSFLTNYFIDLDIYHSVMQNDTMTSILGFISTNFNGKELAALDAKGVVGTFVFFYWGSAMLGRFVGAGLMSKIDPGLILSIFGIGAIGLVLWSISSVGFTAMFAILGVGFFNSVMFPTIFSMSIEKLGDNKPEGSGVLCTAIAGGAFIPPLVGSLRDAHGTFESAFILPIFCYAIIFTFALVYRRRSSKALA
ncbi:sugar MFS transporter [Sanyastnella coralliicola]|uniref:sugar MFS transporter n=1 Tax=Sanyastnella coralliicola TaxID=3069118 RepID=UPI0027B9514D|nr:sugar MFS transporter [Longitalea sp. SCSIO 12813]